MKIKIADLKDLVFKALKKYGYTDSEVPVIADVLLYAQLRGNNQGIVKLIGKGLPKNPESAEIKTLKETKLSTLFDGAKNQGMLVMKKAVDTVITKAKEHGFGIVGFNNTASSTGAIGYYADFIARQNLVGFVFAGSPPTVNYHGSYEAIFGTNPISYAIPTMDKPIIIDMATSEIPYFEIRDAIKENKPLKPNVAVDSQGQMTTDATKALDKGVANLLPLGGGYKGYALVLLVEILTGSLIRSFLSTEMSDSYVVEEHGGLLLTIDISTFTDIAKFKKSVSGMCTIIRSQKPAIGVEKVTIPGDRNYEKMDRSLKNGFVEVNDEDMVELDKLV